MALSARSSAGIARNPFSFSAGRNHRPDSPGRGAASALAPPAADPAARDSLSARAVFPVPGPSAWDSASGQVTPCSEPASAARGSASVVRGPPPVPPASGVAAASAVTGCMSASHVLSSLSPEPVFRSSASGLALPSSVAGRDGTRLKYRPGLALRTNTRVARKMLPCFLPVPVRRPRSAARAQMTGHARPAAAAHSPFLCKTSRRPGTRVPEIPAT